MMAVNIDQHIDEYFQQKSTKDLFDSVNQKRVESLQKMRKYFYTFLIPVAIMAILSVLFVGEKGWEIAQWTIIGYVGIGIGMHQKRIRTQRLESSLFNDFLIKFLPNATYGGSSSIYPTQTTDQKIMKNLDVMGTLSGDHSNHFQYIIEKDDFGKSLITLRATEEVIKRKNQPNTYYMNYTIICDQTKRPIAEEVEIIPDNILNFGTTAMENLAFEKIYDVKSKDDTLARMILTPNIMQGLVDFATHTTEPLEKIIFFDKSVRIRRKIATPITTINRNLAIDEVVMRQAYKNFYQEIQYISKLAKVINVDYFGKA